MFYGPIYFVSHDHSVATELSIMFFNSVLLEAVFVLTVKEDHMYV